MKAVLGLLMLIVVASPAAAQIRLFKDGQIVKFGPTKAQRRARQMGVMMGAMSGRQTAPDANKTVARPGQAAGPGIVAGPAR